MKILKGEIFNTFFALGQDGADSSKATAQGAGTNQRLRKIFLTEILMEKVILRTCLVAEAAAAAFLFLLGLSVRILGISFAILALLALLPSSTFFLMFIFYFSICLWLLRHRLALQGNLWVV